jgi:hypothetical protein
MALEVGRAHVVEHQHAILEMPPGQAILDPLLPLQQPIQRLVGFVILDLTEGQDLAQARRRGLFIHRPDIAQFRARRDQAVGHHRHHKIAMAPRGPILRRAQNQAIQGKLADRAQHRRDMTMRQRTVDRQLPHRQPDQRPALQEGLQRFDDLARQPARIGQRSFLGPPVRPRPDSSPAAAPQPASPGSARCR